MDVAFIPPAPAPTPSEPLAAVAETDEFALHLDAAEDTNAPPEEPALPAELTTDVRPRPQPASLAVDAAILFTHAATPQLATDLTSAVTTPAPLLEPSIEGDAQAPTIPPVETKSAPHTDAQVAAPATTARAPLPATPSDAPHAPARPDIAAPPAITAAHGAEPQATGAVAAAPDAQPAALNAASIASAAQPARPTRLAQATQQATQTATPASPVAAAEDAITPAPPSPEALAPAVQAARAAPATQATPGAETAPAQQQLAALNSKAVEELEPADAAAPPPAALASAQRAAAPRAETSPAQPAHNTAAAPSADPVAIDPSATLAVAPDSDIAPSETHTARAAQTATPAAQIAQHIVRRIDNGATRFELRLDPPELGRVDVRLELGRDHRVTAVIAAEEPATLAQLTRAAREIELTLESAGLELAENGLSFDLSGGGEAGRDAQSFSAGAHAAPARGLAESDPPLARRALALESWRGARVDLVA